jgi:hypothetical protein
MASVIVTQQNNQVVVSPTANSLIEVIARGPQGPPGPPTTGSGLFVDDAAKIDKSIVYYDAPSSRYKADATWTTSTIVDGANF